VNKYCPITYEAIADHMMYSIKGLKLLSPKLRALNPFPFSLEEQMYEISQRSHKISVQGVQPKLSAVLNPSEKCFSIVDRNAKYILKPQNNPYPQLPENEALTMKLAQLLGIDVPLSGLIYAKDQKMVYFVKRFDRVGVKKKIPVEDFAQLSGKNRDTKYNSSMEKVLNIVESFCTFPLLEKKKLVFRTIFNFLVGNEDMHLKNFSLITRENKIELSPAYDQVNSTIVLKEPQDEIALPLNGKKNNIKRSDIIQYFAKEKAGLNDKIILEMLNTVKDKFYIMQTYIDRSFLSGELKKKYLELMKKRMTVLFG